MRPNCSTGKIIMKEADMPIEYIGIGIGAVFLLIFLFIILREVMLWYFRVNEIVTILKEIRDALQIGKDRAA